MGIGRMGARLLAVALFAVIITGCSGVRKNVAYFPAGEAGTKLSKTMTCVILPVQDVRESAKIYPKQIISRTSYYGKKSSDINDKPVDQIFENALSTELYNLGLGLTRVSVDMPLDKTTKEKVRQALLAENPDIKVAVGLKVLDFMAYSTRNFLTTDVKFVASIELYVLDVQSGDLLWSDYKSERTDTVLSASRNYMVDELDVVLSDVMKKAVRQNLSLRDALVKAANR